MYCVCVYFGHVKEIKSYFCNKMNKNVVLLMLHCVVICLLLRLPQPSFSESDCLSGLAMVMICFHDDMLFTLYGSGIPQMTRLYFLPSVQILSVNYWACQSLLVIFIQNAVSMHFMDLLYLIYKCVHRACQGGRSSG